MAKTSEHPTKSKATIASVNKDIAQAAVAKFLDFVEQGGHSWDKGHTGKSAGLARPINLSTGKEYSGFNAVMLGLASPYSSNQWITGKQLKVIRDKMVADGVPENKLPYIRQDEKGNYEKATMGIFSKPMPFKKTTKDAASGEEKIEAGVSFMSSTFWVYNAEQIENCPGQEIIKGMEREFDPVAGAEQAMEALKAKTGLKIKFDKGNYYVPSSDEIHLFPKEAFKSEYDFYGTALHEVGHCMAAKHRCNEEDALRNRFGDKAYAHEELRAEITSLLLSLDMGIAPSEDHLKNHAAYVESWKRDLPNNPSVLLSAFSRADGRVNAIRKVVHEYALEQGIEPLIQAPRAERAPEVKPTLDVEKKRVATPTVAVPAATPARPKPRAMELSL